MIDDLGKPEKDKAAASALFTWRMLRRVWRADLQTYSQAVMFEGVRQIEYAACKLLPDDPRAEVRLWCTLSEVRPRAQACSPSGKLHNLRVVCATIGTLNSV